MNKPDFSEVLQDRPVRVLFIVLIGSVSLVCALTVRAALRLQQTPRRAAAAPTRRPTPLPFAPGPHLLTAQELRLLRRINATPSARFEQQELSGELDAEEAVEQVDSHLSRWGQEYQQVELTGGSTRAKLVYVLNLPDQPELRGVVIAQRIKRGRRRYTLRQSLIAPEGAFPALARELEPFGLRLR